MNATSQKERQYALLAERLNQLSAQMDGVAYNFEGFKVDLEAMKTFAGLQTSQFMAISRLLDAEELTQAQEQPEQSAKLH